VKKIVWLAVLILVSGSCLALDPKVLISPAVISQGKCFTVKVVSAEGVTEAKVEFLGREIAGYKSGDDYKTVIGVPPEQKPAIYPLIITLIKDDGIKQEIKRSIKVRPYKFASVWFWLKPAKKRLFTAQLINEEWGRIEKTLVVEAPEQRWEERFLLPAKGRVSMTFGSKEFVNRKRSGQHRGLDLAVPIGTKILAANSGRVAFVEPLKAFGGTIVIDHGQGVHSLYFHLSKFLADVGQEVAKGQAIALSGNSGISSGPHLHWGMSVHNLRIDPLQWTKYAF